MSPFWVTREFVMNGTSWPTEIVAGWFSSVRILGELRTLSLPSVWSARIVAEILSLVER